MKSLWPRLRKDSTVAPAALALAFTVPFTISEGASNSPAAGDELSHEITMTSEFAADDAGERESAKSAAARCWRSVRRGHHSEAITAAEISVELAGTAAERSRGNHCLGVGLLRQFLEKPFQAERTGPLRRAAEAFRLALTDPGKDRREVLLGLAETLVLLGEYREAAEVLQSYSDAGGRDPLAGELRCWTDFAAWASGREGTSDPVVRRASDGGVRAPRRIAGPFPRYTDEARRARVSGVIFLEALLDERGRVACARVVGEGLPNGLNDAAVTALKESRFEPPATLDGEPTPVATSWTTNFTLQ